MLTYLAIGLVVQLLITTERILRGVVPTDFSDFDWSDWAMFVGVLIIGGISNILAWPFAVIAEVYNIARGA